MDKKRRKAERLIQRSQKARRRIHLPTADESNQEGGGAERIVTIEKGDRDQSKHDIPAMAGTPREGVNIINNIN